MMRPTLSSLVVLALAACQCDEPLRDLAPRLAVTPEAIAHPLLCAPVEETVRLRNDGNFPLRITAVRVVGSGWGLTPPALPLILGVREERALGLYATDGAAMLQVESDDPTRPLLELPLSARANSNPTLSLIAPRTGATVAEGLAVDVESLSSDPDGARDALQVRLLDGAGNIVQSSAVGPDGLSSLAWAPEQRPTGNQPLTVEVRDRCGAVASQRLDLCLDATSPYQPLQLEGWHYEGATRQEAGSGELVLTPAERYQAGSAFDTGRIVDGGRVDISFGFRIAGGTGADGFSLTALDTEQATTLLGPRGCGIGYGGDAPCTQGPGLPGWSVEFDTFYNPEVDPTTQPHVAFALDGALESPPLWVEVPQLVDDAWHQMRVEVAAPHVRVTIDDAVVLEGEVEGRWNFPAWVGFTAATGGKTDEHRIRGLTVTRHLCP